MNLQEIRENICCNAFEPDSPIQEGLDFINFVGDEIDTIETIYNNCTKSCFCDNCFYGRTFLTLEVMRLMKLSIEYLFKHTEEF